MVSLRSSVRTTETKVKELKDTDLDDSDLQQSMNMANTIVETYLVNEGLSSNQLEDIETALSAHFVSLSMDKEEISFSTSDLSADFSIEPGQGLNATPFGQQALLLDDSGKLDQLMTEDKGRTATVQSWGDWS